jgi:hypothetical protein
MQILRKMGQNQLILTLILILRLAFLRFTVCRMFFAPTILRNTSLYKDRSSTTFQNFHTTESYASNVEFHYCLDVGHKSR